MDWPFNPISLLTGMQLIESIHMTKEVKIPESRSLKERLFTVPWRPLQKTKYRIETIPSDEFIQYGTMFIGHPETIRKLKTEIEKQALRGFKP